MICVAVSLFALAPWGEPDVLPTSMTVVAQVSIEGSPAQAGDVLAAFVIIDSQEVLRGKELITSSGNIAGCIIQIYTEQTGETVLFRIWDESAQLVYRASQDIESVVNGTLGSYPDNLFQISTSYVEQTVLAPVFNPPGGTYTSVQNVAISCPTPGATIRYTTNGLDPTETSPLYFEPIFVGLNTTIKAKAFRAEWIPSSTVTAEYTISGGQIADPWPTPEALTGSMVVMAQVNLYGEPANAGDIVAAFVNEGESEVLRGKQAVEVNNGIAGCLMQVYSENSGEQIRFKVWDYSEQAVLPVTQTLLSQVNGIVGSYPNNMYMISTGIVDTPVISPSGGSYSQSFYAEIHCPTEGAEIRYTDDGSIPNASSMLYTQPIWVSRSSTYKARAFLGSWIPSEVAVETYILPSANPEDPLPPVVTGIRDIYPNPFSTSVTLLLGVKEANQDYKLKIYNIRGELVYESSGMASGDFKHTWNGCATDGRKLSAGIYLVSFKSGATKQTRKAILK
jgi:hypothetical protein